MNIKEIRKGAPSGATGYIELNKSIYYVRKIREVWHTSYNYDCGAGWGLLNSEHINKIKPLY